MEKQNVTGARKGICLVCDRGLRRKKASHPERWGLQNTKQARRRGLKLIPKE